MQDGEDDPSQSGYWSVRESFVSFILTNAPMVYPLFKRWIEKGVSMASSDRGTGLGESQGYRLGSFNRSAAGTQSKRAKMSNIDPTLDTVLDPGESKWGSEERIVARTTDKGNGSSDEDSSLRGFEDSGRVRGRQSGGGYADAAMVPNTSTAVQGADGSAATGKWNPPGRQIMVTTEYSVSSHNEAAERRRGAMPPQP